MNDYTQQLEQQNEELKERLAKYEAAVEPIFGLLVRCEKRLEENNKELVFCNGVVMQNNNNKDNIIVECINKNKELAEQCSQMYDEQAKGLKEFDRGKWLDFYVDTYNMKK